MKYGGGASMEGALLPAWSDEEPRDLLDALLAPHDPDLAELKPLPPFTGYTGHLSINGIPGHHYHAIAQRLPEENNNYAPGAAYAEHDVVSSSTAPPDASRASPRAAGADLFADGPQPKTEMYDISSIEDIAAIIGSAIADTTVPSQPDDPERAASRDSWMDLDAWIEGACGAQQAAHDALAEFSLPHSPPHLAADFACRSPQDYSARAPDLAKCSAAGSTLQTLLTHGYMPLLQNRLQNGPPVKQELPSSTSYGLDAISTSSPPGNAVSTTDSLLLSGRYVTHHYAFGLKADGLCSPDPLLGANFPHTTTVTPLAGKSKRSRCQKKAASAHAAAAGLALQSAVEGLGGLLGKEKPVHRCNICNRGFLNKSNIKVHLRTHTGEKPFRCEVCAKAFRQKAHLIKHQQIHKRIGRD